MIYKRDWIRLQHRHHNQNYTCPAIHFEHKFRDAKVHQRNFPQRNLCGNLKKQFAFAFLFFFSRFMRTSLEQRWSPLMVHGCFSYLIPEKLCSLASRCADNKFVVNLFST